MTPYNKHSTGLVEQGHFTIRQAILKDCRKHPEQWPSKVPLAFFADHVKPPGVLQDLAPSTFFMVHTQYFLSI